MDKKDPKKEKQKEIYTKKETRTNEDELVKNCITAISVCTYLRELNHPLQEKLHNLSDCSFYCLRHY